MRAIRGGREEKSGLYGHCTVECSCCIRFQGVCLPQPERAASQSAKSLTVKMVDALTVDLAKQTASH